jgi:hypothetical protein
MRGWVDAMAAPGQYDFMLKAMNAEAMGSWINGMIDPNVVRLITQFARADVSGRWVETMSNPQVMSAAMAVMTPQTMLNMMNAFAQVEDTAKGRKSRRYGQAKAP